MFPYWLLREPLCSRAPLCTGAVTLHQGLAISVQYLPVYSGGELTFHTLSESGVATYDLFSLETLSPDMYRVFLFHRGYGVRVGAGVGA